MIEKDKIIPWFDFNTQINIEWVLFVFFFRICEENWYIFTWVRWSIVSKIIKLIKSGISLVQWLGFFAFHYWLIVWILSVSIWVMHIIKKSTNQSHYCHRQSIISSESRSRSSSKSSFKWSSRFKHLYFRENKVTLWNWTAGMYLWALQMRRVSGEKLSGFIKTLPCYIDLSRWQNYISSL